MSDDFRKDIEEVINTHSKESISDTPDFILAKYLIDCLNAFDQAVLRRKAWFSTPEATKESIIPESTTVADLGQTSKELKTHLNSEKS